ncbi:MAG: sensor histidine kinase, partial [Ruminiclostridium sp.]
KKWTTEAITNILDNAVKYTQSNGKIKMSVQKYELFARVDIEDNGIGFEETEVNDVFKRFYRGKNARKEDGVGIGLYLAREIIAKQEGYIKVKSKVGAGSKFSILLPLR